MKFEIKSFEKGNPIPGKYAFCVPDEKTKVKFGGNKNPHLVWEGAPENTKSFAILCHDPDVPSKPDDVNQEGKEVPEDLPRVDFYHWVLIDIPKNVGEMPEGADSDGVTAKGKPMGPGAFTGFRGLNNYTQWFEGDPEMGGYYAGYDGPCPPWNDSIIHRYIFKIYALDVDSLKLTGNFTGPDVLKAMEGHILGDAEWMGTYTLNARLLGE